MTRQTHAVTVALAGPGRYSVDCSCRRLATYTTDFDLALTITVHLNREAAEDASPPPASQPASP